MPHQLRRRTDGDVRALVRGSDGNHGLQFGTEDWIGRSNAESFQPMLRQTRSYAVCGFGLPATTDAIARALACNACGLNACITC